MLPAEVASRALEMSPKATIPGPNPSPGPSSASNAFATDASTGRLTLDVKSPIKSCMLTETAAVSPPSAVSSTL